MPLILQRRIYRQDLRANRAILYCFGDNEARVGFGGQAAEMRDEPNAIGIATLVAPGVFWNEDNFTHQAAVLDGDFVPVFCSLSSGGIVVFPADGVGTGLADLERKSPTTFAYLQTKIEQMKRYLPVGAP